MFGYVKNILGFGNKEANDNNDNNDDNKKLKIERVKRVFVFDMDLTITNTHTCGHYSHGNSSQYITPKRKLYFNQFLKVFDNQNDWDARFYIVSRGKFLSVLEFMRDIDCLHMLDGVYGATDFRDITDKKLSVFDKDGHQKFPLSSVSWDEHKVYYMNKIRKLENVKRSDIIFFDDTKVNIDTAKISGYVNSFLVNNSNKKTDLFTYLKKILNNI